MVFLNNSPARWMEVPLPLDPVTGAPFGYRLEKALAFADERLVEAKRAILYAPPPAGEEPAEHNALVYELTLRR